MDAWQCQCPPGVSHSFIHSFIHSFSANFFQAHQGGVRRDFHRGRPQVDESRRAGFRLVLVSMHEATVRHSLDFFGYIDWKFGARLAKWSSTKNHQIFMNINKKSTLYQCFVNLTSIFHVINKKSTFYQSYINLK